MRTTTLLVTTMAAVLVIVAFSQKTTTLMNGVCLVAPSDKVTLDQYDPIKKINANWVAIIPYGFCSIEQPEVVYNHSHQWWGEKSEGVEVSIKYAHQKGLKVMLKPHLWVKGQGWAGDLAYSSDEDLSTWKRSYRDYILHFCKIAARQQVELIAIGTEIRKIAVSDATFFKTLIADIRLIYDGELTYAANWDNYDNISFWGELDYIGVDAYFPTSTMQTPTVSDLKAANADLVQVLGRFSEDQKRKIIFTEFGFESKDYCAAGHWNTRDEKPRFNTKGQANAYQAFFESFWGQDWFAGGFAWKWYYDHSTAGGQQNLKFTPQNKPAEIILANGYKESD